jgi:hypothetical protein
MRKLSPTAGLKQAIQLLEAEQAINGQLLKVQFQVTYESFKPVNLLRRTLKDISASQALTDDLLGTAVGLTAGYLTKKIVVGSSENPYRQVMGSMLQNGVTTIIAEHPEVIKSVGRFIYNLFSSKKI